MNINEIENELETLLASDKKAWVKIYELMEQVDKEKLYEGKFSSFTAWVNYLAERSKVHVSILWSRKKAGSAYAAYEQRQNEKGVVVKPMKEVTVSPDNFVLVEKIAGNNTKVADELIEKVVNGELKRSDLKNAWATVRSERTKKGLPVAPKNAHDKNIVAQTNADSEAPEGKTKASDIVLALSTNSKWIPEAKEKKYVDDKYKTMAEFAVRTGSSHSARRIDALVLENLSANAADEICLHGIEIKVDKSDLLNDHKMAEFTNFVDYFWIAVPAKLEAYAQEIRGDKWGVLIVDTDNNVTVATAAQKLDAAFREVTLTSAVLKLL